MDISALLVNPSEAPARRSSSIPHAVSQASPASSASKLPTPPLSTNKPMQRKRKRHDPKPIWAVREGEPLEPHHQQLLQEQQQKQQQQQESREARPAPQPRPQQQAPPPVHRNGPSGPSPGAAVAAPEFKSELQGYERPVSDDPKVYDEISRAVCDFIWKVVVDNEHVRRAIAESPHTQLEIEARWGQMQDKHSSDRLRGIHATECIVRNGVADTKFESTMSEAQHKRMNQYLNLQVQRSQSAMRPVVKYVHTREIDMFYDLDEEALNILPPLTQKILRESHGRSRIRLTRDQKTNMVLKKIIKHRIANLEISSPMTEWDYRIGINLEIDFPGAIENLTPVVERNKSPQDMERRKDRMSYSWLDAYQIDLTQVIQTNTKNHELELEVSPEKLLKAADAIKMGATVNDFESLVAGMMNNLRVLSREITPA